MSNPMTEARLVEIEVFVNRNAEADMIAMSRVGMVDIIAEIRRLRECINNAPIGKQCDSNACIDIFEIWQREALGE